MHVCFMIFYLAVVKRINHDDNFDGDDAGEKRALRQSETYQTLGEIIQGLSL